MERLYEWKGGVEEVGGQNEEVDGVDGVVGGGG